MTPTDEAKKLIAELPRIEQDGIVLPYIPEVDVESLVTRLLADKERLREALRLEHARALIEKASHRP